MHTHRTQLENQKQHKPYDNIHVRHHTTHATNTTHTTHNTRRTRHTSTRHTTHNTQHTTHNTHEHTTQDYICNVFDNRVSAGLNEISASRSHAFPASQRIRNKRRSRRAAAERQRAWRWRLLRTDLATARDFWLCLIVLRARVAQGEHKVGAARSIA